MCHKSIYFICFFSVPPSVSMSQKTGKGWPDSRGSTQYSPFVAVGELYLISLQDKPNSAGMEPRTAARNGAGLGHLFLFTYFVYID